MADLNLRMNRGDEKGDIYRTAGTASAAGVLSVRWDNAVFENTDEVAKHVRLMAQYVRETGVTASSFADVASDYERPRLWVPCNEGSGTALNNIAGDNTLDTGAILDATAWDDYDVDAGRACVRIESTAAVNSLINEFSPVRNFAGNTDNLPSSVADSWFTACMIRWEDLPTAAAMGPEVGAANSPCTITRQSDGDCTFAVCDNVFFTLAGTGTRVLGYVVFAEPATTVSPWTEGSMNIEWCLIEFDDTTGAVINTWGDDRQHAMESTTLDYNQDGGLDAEGTVDLVSNPPAGAGNYWEMYGWYYAQMPYGSRPGFSNSADLRGQAIKVFKDWRVGLKDIPASWYQGAV